MRQLAHPSVQDITVERVGDLLELDNSWLATGQEIS